MLPVPEAQTGTSRSPAQFVPVGFMPTGGTHDVCVAIDTHNLLREAKLNAVFSKEITVHKRERFCASSAKIL